MQGIDQPLLAAFSPGFSPSTALQSLPPFSVHYLCLFYHRQGYSNGSPGSSHPCETKDPNTDSRASPSRIIEDHWKSSIIETSTKLTSLWYFLSSSHGIIQMSSFVQDAASQSADTTHYHLNHLGFLSVGDIALLVFSLLYATSYQPSCL